MLNSFFKMDLMNNSSIEIKNIYNNKDVYFKLNSEKDPNSILVAINFINRQYKNSAFLKLIKQGIFIDDNENELINKFLEYFKNISIKEKEYLLTLAIKFLENARFYSNKYEESIFTPWNSNNPYIKEPKNHLIIFYKSKDDLLKIKELINSFVPKTICFFEIYDSNILSIKSVGPFIDINNLKIDSLVEQMLHNKLYYKIREYKSDNNYFINQYISACLDYQSNYLIDESIIVERKMLLKDKCLYISKLLYQDLII